MSEAPWGPSARKPVLYRLVRGVTIAVVLAGVVVGLHRNDLLREGARRIGKEAQYLELERRLIGVPGYGTPRSVETNLHAAASPAPADAAPVAAAQPTTPAATTSEPTPEPASAPAPAAAPAQAPEAVAATPAPSPSPEPVAKLEAPPPVAAAPAAEPVDPLKPISLDQLPVLRSGHASAKTLAPAEPAPVAASTPRSAAKVQVFDLDADAPKAKKAEKPRAEKVVQAAAPKPAPKKEKEPDPTAPRAGDNPLKAAIRDAMRKQSAK